MCWQDIRDAYTRARAVEAQKKEWAYQVEVETFKVEIEREKELEHKLTIARYEKELAQCQAEKILLMKQVQEDDDAAAKTKNVVLRGDAMVEISSIFHRYISLDSARSHDRTR
jgi:hypothetical protein